MRTQATVSVTLTLGFMACVAIPVCRNFIAGKGGGSGNKLAPIVPTKASCEAKYGGTCTDEGVPVASIKADENRTHKILPAESAPNPSIPETASASDKAA